MKIIECTPHWPISDEREEKAVNSVLRSGVWWRNAGTYVKEFEKEFAKYIGCQGGIAVSNGTIAIEIALKALEIGCGDEVIVPDFTFFSTVSAVLSVHAVPVLVDVDPETYCIDANGVEHAITQKTKAIIAVHMAGHIADMEKLELIAKKYNLLVIEDASHAHGAIWKNKKAGSFGDLSTFSFQNAKLMTAGEGGIILGNRKELLDRVLLEANCGRREDDTSYNHVLIGTNARMSEMHGAILKVQLSRLEQQNTIRALNYQLFEELILAVPGIKLQKMDKSAVNPHYMIMFYYDKSKFGGASRNDFVNYLNKSGIPANRSYEVIHNLPVFNRLKAKSWRLEGILNNDGTIHCPNAERISQDVVCLNHRVLLGDQMLIKDIVDVIRTFNNY